MEYKWLRVRYRKKEGEKLIVCGAAQIITIAMPKEAETFGRRDMYS